MVIFLAVAAVVVFMALWIFVDADALSTPQSGQMAWSAIPVQRFLRFRRLEGMSDWLADAVNGTSPA